MCTKLGLVGLRAQVCYKVMLGDMNLPNGLTVTRIILVPPLVGVLLTSPSPAREIYGFLVFALAAGTDYFDGYLARKRSQITRLGQLLDPLADKLLISAAFISLVELDIAPAWMVIIVVAREFAITGLRGIASAQGYTISASQLGKYKMVAQVACVSCLIIANRFPETLIYRSGQLLLWLVVVLSIASMVQYFHRFWSFVDSDGGGVALRDPEQVVPQDRISERESA